MTTPAKYVAALSACIGIVVFVIAPLDGLDVVSSRVLGLTVIVVSLWVTGIVSPALPTIILFLVVMLFGLAPASVTFSGFSAGAAWLTFTGIIFGLAIHRTGLGDRLARVLLQRFGQSYAGAIVGTVLAGFVFCFLMPSSMGRCAILIPLVIALADALGLSEGRRGRIGLIMAAVFSTVMSGYSILPAGIPTVVMAGAAESLFGIVLHFAPYMLLHFPVTGVMTLLSITALSLILFKDRVDHAAVPEIDIRPWTAQERRLTVILVAVLALWTTDFLHGVSPAWIGLSGAIVCVLPYVGAIDAEAMAKDCDYTPWIFTVGIISLGSVIAASGLAPSIGSTIFAFTDFEPGSDGKNFATMIAVYSAIAGVTTTAGVAPLLTPMANDIATIAGWPILTVLMAHTIGQYVILYPYQIPPILTGALLGRISLLNTTLMGLCWSVIYLAVIAPLSFVWWRWLGMFS
ncbi:MAG: citrate transporter [Rhodospirillaceae bacterium]|nr:citrate transporter [Rhodospirillaceae bacterium]